MGDEAYTDRLIFLSTPSARRATSAAVLEQCIAEISIHALREEGDRPRRKCASVQRYFYPRPPRGGRLHSLQVHRADAEISIHALREEGDSICVSTFYSYIISIHALREEGDPSTASRLLRASDFYPRPPRGGRRATSILSTRNTDFYPRPPRGGRLGDAASATTLTVFLSTPSARRATADRTRLFCDIDISIHALREEGDLHTQRHTRRRRNFYPRPPRGGRPALSELALCPRYFYPRPPRGGRRAAPGR